MGMTPHQYVLNARPGGLLSPSRAPMSRVAELFRKSAEETPSAFRRPSAQSA
jgi:hypothetical protein